MTFFFRNPNPYRPELIADARVSTYSAAGNEKAGDPISGVIFGFPGFTIDPIGNGSGGGVATHTFFGRFLTTPTKSTARVVESFTCFPETQSMCDGRPPSDTTTTRTFPPTSLPIDVGIGLKAGHARAESNFAFNDDGTISLIRSGYAVVTGAESITFMRGDANIGDFDASTPAQLVFTGNSPISLLVTDAQGHRIGFNPPPNPPPAHVDARPTVVAEILGASYSGVGTHPQVIKLPDPKPGSYQVKVTGTGTGSFSLTMETLTVNGGLIDRETTSGTASPGSSNSFNLNVTAVGRLSMGGAPPADAVPPTTVASATPAANGAGWNNTNVTVMLSATDNAGGSGVQEITFSASGAQTIASTTVSGASATIDITTEGQTTITFFAKDHAGNIESAKSLIVKLDKTPPTIAGTRTPRPNANGWNNTNVTVGFTCADSLSGLAPGSPPAPTILSSEGAGQLVSGTCQDLADNSAGATVSGINIDKTPPILTVTTNPPPNGNGWNNSDVTVSFAAVDTLSGVDIVSGPVTLTAEGAGQVVTGSAMDKAGNLAVARVTLNIDKTPPEAFNQFDPINQDLAVFGRDSLSGVPPGALIPIAVVPANRNDEDDGSRHGDDSEGGELRTYRVSDRAGNFLLLVEKVKKEGHEIKARVVSLQYGHGPVLTAPPNRKDFEWALKKDGTLKELEQKLEVTIGKERQELEAKFEAQKNQTTIKREEPEPETKLVKPGLVLLRLATDKGALVLEF